MTLLLSDLFIRLCLSNSRRIHDWAACPVSDTDFDQRGDRDGACCDAVRATGFEPASRRKLGDRRHGAFDSREGKGAVGRERGNGAQQALGIGMSGRAENVGLCTEFDQAAGVHDGYAIGDVRDDGEVVRDEEHRQSKFVAKVVEQVENLLLDGDIKRSSGFVGNEQLRAVDDGHGDHDTLAHSSRNLVRIAAGSLLRVGDGNVAHAFDGSAPGFGFRDTVVSEHGFGNLVADAHDGVEGGHGLLEDHGDAQAAKLAQRIGGQAGELRGEAAVLLRAIPKSDLARDHGRRGKQAHDG